MGSVADAEDVEGMEEEAGDSMGVVAAPPAAHSAAGRENIVGSQEL